ncbi:glutathione S-transferase F12 [Canna indica]|uniref:glutathione transferase n=1 Tax=Canna indica TaxID=4628 RepID=A0AAQ3Q6Z2_9LILI|nr:glutathione S-transferase F12 [Canna indica]
MRCRHAQANRSSDRSRKGTCKRSSRTGEDIKEAAGGILSAQAAQKASSEEIKMVVKVYGKAQAVCPQRVMHCLVELGVPFELVHIDIDAMEHKLPEFMSKQPFGQVPYIADGDFELFESRAIVRYLAAKYSDRRHGTPNLLGRTPEERARVEQWMDVEAINYNPWAFPVVLNLFVLPMHGVPENKAEAAAAVEKLDQVLEVYEKHLSKSKYLAGDEFTLADLTHIPATRYVVECCGMGRIFDEKKHVKAWWEDITGRPAWKKVMSFVESGASNYYP